MSDSLEHIIENFTARSPGAFDLVYDRYAGNLYGYLLQMIKDEAIAQDVLQESFVKIWKNADRYDPNKSRLFTWMLSICRNGAIDRIRKMKKRQEKEIQSVDSSVLHMQVFPRPEFLDIQKQLDTLEDKYASVIRMLFFEGYTQVETSEHLEIPLGTVKTRLKIGLRELRKVYNFKNNAISLLILMSWMTG